MLRTKSRMSRGAPRSIADERADYELVHARSKGQCEVVLDRVRCARPRMPGVHHVIKRAQGGKFKGPDYLMDLCAPCHDLADNASRAQRTMIGGRWVAGRLRIAALGQGRFRCWMERSVETVGYL